MKKFLMTIAAAALLSACGTTTGDRGLSGAGIGAGIGIIGGPVGMLVGGAAGATVGAVTSPDQIDLGRPVWRA
jgi:osmotically inducible lipoprotein OsmB